MLRRTTRTAHYHAAEPELPRTHCVWETEEPIRKAANYLRRGFCDTPPSPALNRLGSGQLRPVTRQKEESMSTMTDTKMKDALDHARTASQELHGAISDAVAKHNV